MIPNHVAIIMDGNGRWANKKGRPRIFGHLHGASKLKKVIKECGRSGVGYLTLYAFSTENWGRPTDEVQFLMRLLCKYLEREQKTLLRENVRFTTIGQIENLPKQARDIIQKTIEVTKNNTGLCLVFALSYGSRSEILMAVKEIVASVVKGELSQEQISTDSFSRYLFTKDIPDPDLIIRTSGEQRLSNFLLWQSAYSEIYFTHKLWPEFEVDDLRIAFDNYSKRQRRFGLTGSQIAEESTTT